MELHIFLSFLLFFSLCLNTKSLTQLRENWYVLISMTANLLHIQVFKKKINKLSIYSLHIKYYKIKYKLTSKELVLNEVNTIYNTNNTEWLSLTAYYKINLIHLRNLCLLPKFHCIYSTYFKKSLIPVIHDHLFQFWLIRINFFSIYVYIESVLERVALSDNVILPATHQAMVDRLLPYCTAEAFLVILIEGV